MRASALLGVPVVDPVEGTWGVVADVLVDVPEPDRTVLRWEVAGLVVSPPGVSSWWHFTGLTSSRQGGPWPLTALGRGAARRSWFVPASSVVRWDEGRLVVERVRARPAAEAAAVQEAPR